MKIIELSIGKVEIVDVLTWGMQEEIRSSMLGGIKIQGLNPDEAKKLELDPTILGEAKFKAIELCIKKITLTDGTDILYSKPWMQNLTIEDGDKLYNAINEVTNPIKK